MHLKKPVAALAVAMMLSAAACEGFYADVPTLTPGPAATPTSAAATPEFTGTRAEIAEAAARSALAARLGIAPGKPSFAGLRGATWTRSNPGCYPPPEGFDGDYLIPGLRLSLVYDAIRYEYHADVPATTGALCYSVPQTPQEVSVDLAEDTVRTLDASRLAGRVVTLPDAGAAQAFLRDEPGIAEIDVEDIDWAAEVLVGALLTDMPSTQEAEAAEGLWHMHSNLVTIDVDMTPVETPPEGIVEGPIPAPVWVLVEYPPAGASFELQLAENSPAAGSP